MAANIINRDSYTLWTSCGILLMKYSSQKKKIKPESDQASKFQFIGNNRGSQNPINTSKRMENGTEKSRIRETPQETQ